MTSDITAGSVWSRIPKRGRESNKGSFGAVLPDRIVRSW